MKKIILNIVLSMCFAFFITPVIPAYAASDIYVDYVNGSDSNGGTENAPLKTVNVAVDMAEAGDTIILKGAASYIEPLGNTDDPLVIDKSLTIKGNDASVPVNVSARCGGIILGADVTFENMSFGVASFLRTGIAANGHSLTLTNVSGAVDLRELQIYGGTFFDYSDETKDFGDAYRGNKSVITITGGNIPVVYAGSVNGGFDKDVSIEVIKADGDMSLGTIYACSARKVAENDVAGSIPSASVDYVQSGAITIDIDGAPVRAVNGARNEYSTASVALSVNSNGTYSCELSRVDELTVKGGIFAPEGELPKQITIGNGENVATLDLASKMTAPNLIINRLQCNAGSILILDRYGSLTISDSHTGTAELRTEGGMPYSSESVPGYSGMMEYEHSYIHYGTTGNTGVFTIDRPYPSQVGCIAFQEEHLQGWVTSEEPFDVIQLETFNIVDTVKNISFESMNGLDGASVPKIPVEVSFSEDTTFLELACIPFSCKVTYAGREYVQTAVADEYGYYSCSIPELTLFLEFMGDTENTETVFLPRLILNSEGNRVSAGTYEIEITVPVTSEFVTDSITIQVASEGETSEEKTSEWDKYSSYYYYNQLPEEKRIVWDEMEEICQYYLENNVDIPDNYVIDVKDTYTIPEATKWFEDLVYMFRVSHPQYYFVSNATGVEKNGDDLKCKLLFISELSEGAVREEKTGQFKQQLEEWNAIVAKCDSDYEKVKTISQLLCGELTYDSDALSLQSAVAVCDEKTGCYGYALAFELLCNYAGIEAVCVDGDAGETHIWNRVKLDGCWYIIDITRMDKEKRGIDYTYFLKSSANMSTHSCDERWSPYLQDCTVDSGSNGYDVIKYEIQTLPQMTAPAITLRDTGADYNVSIAGSDGGAIYYTTDGTVPSQYSKKCEKYKESFTVSYGTEIKAIAVKHGYYDSETASSGNGQTITLSFHANGGTVSTAQKDVVNGNNYGWLPYAVREGYVFTGWFLEESLTNRITSKDIVALGQNTPLYAGWKEEKMSGHIYNGTKKGIDWQIDDAGVLTISGSGESYENGEWRIYKDEILSAVVDVSGITGLYGMFQDCSKLQEVDLSNVDMQKITDVGRLFYYCTSLKSLDMSSWNLENVTETTGMLEGCESIQWIKTPLKLHVDVRLPASNFKNEAGETVSVLTKDSAVSEMLVNSKDVVPDNPPEDEPPADDPPAVDQPTDDPPADDPPEKPGEIPGATPNPTPTVPQPSKPTQDWPFGDVAVKTGNWKYEAVKYVYNNKIMNGVGDGTRFDPDAPLTREMFATVLYRMAGEPTVTFKNKFPDVPQGKWYSNAVIWASEQGIVSGYGSGNFGTGHYITREQIAKMFMEYGRMQGYDVSEKAAFSSFADAGKVSGWANDYMKWAVGSGMIGGSLKDGKYYLNPKGNATRAESATMLKRFMEKY